MLLDYIPFSTCYQLVVKNEIRLAIQFPGIRGSGTEAILNNYVYVEGYEIVFLEGR